MDFLEEKENEIIRNIMDPKDFIDDSFETVYLGMDITLIVGQLKAESLVQWQLNPGRRCVQGVKFEKPTWSLDAALEWLKENQKHFNQNFEAVQKTFAKLGRSIRGVEIFATGHWNGDTFTEKDLDQMVQNFIETKDHIPPFLKLGHDNDQNILKNSGLPAAGWVSNIYRSGSKLLADFRDIPEKIFQLIEKGAYRKVSIELFSGLQILDRKFNNLVGAVALLGAETPGVMVLDDILARYGLKDYDKLKKVYDRSIVDSKSYDYDMNNKEKGGLMPEIDKDLIDAKAQIKDLEKKLQEAQASAEKFKTDAEKTAEEVAQVKESLAETQKEFSKTAEQLKVQQIEGQVNELVAAGLISKAMKPFVSQLLDAEKKEFKKEDKEVSRFELIKETLELAKATDVNFDDNSEDAEGERKDFANDEAMDKKIKEYMTEKKCSYAKAYKAIAKEMKAK